MCEQNNYLDKPMVKFAGSVLIMSFTATGTFLSRFFLSWQELEGNKEKLQEVKQDLQDGKVRLQEVKEDLQEVKEDLQDGKVRFQEVKEELLEVKTETQEGKAMMRQVT